MSIESDFRSTNGVMEVTLKTKINGCCQVSCQAHYSVKFLLNLPGIFRDVHLLAFPKLGHIDDFNVRTALNSQYRDANLVIGIRYLLLESATIEIELRDQGSDSDSVIPRQKFSLDTSSTARSFTFAVENPRK